MLWKKDCRVHIPLWNVGFDGYAEQVLGYLTMYMRDELSVAVYLLGV